jgi:hypothetical protein
MIRIIAIACAAMLATACAGTGRLDAPRSDSRSDSAQRQILLTVREQSSFATSLTGAPNQRYLHRRYGPTPAVERTLNQLAREHRLARVEGWPIRSLAVYCEVFEVPQGISIDETIARIAADPRVDLVQRMNLFETENTRYDDPYVDFQSAAAQLGIEQAHLLATGRNVLIAIIDSAVDSSHPDLRGRVSITRNLVDARESSRGGEVHGTAVAGVIASAVNNSEGIIGVAPDASIAALRACWPVATGSPSARCSTFSLARALEVALTLGPKVINMSLAGPSDPLLSRLLDEIIRRGMVVVAAQSESADLAAQFPASHPRVIAAHSSAEPFAAEQSRYRLGAPATEVLTTTPGASYAFLSGNSLAAAHTTGVVALLMEREPDLDIEEVAALLTDTMTHSTGSFSINACRALDRLTGAKVCDQPIELVRF